MNTSYQEYLNNAEIREAVEREVRCARAQAFRQFIWSPLKRLFGNSRQQAAVLVVRPA